MNHEKILCMNHESLVEKYLGITNYHTEKIPLPSPNQSPLPTFDTFKTYLLLCVPVQNIYEDDLKLDSVLFGSA